MERFAEPELLEAYRADQSQGGRNFWPTYGALWDSLKAKLRAGELVATGYSGSLTPQVIPPDAWQFLDCMTTENLQKSTVVGNGIEVVSVRVQEPTHAGRRTAEADCRAWLRDRARHKSPLPTRDVLHAEAKRLFPELTRAAFLRVWRAAAPKKAKLPGRRKSVS